MSNRRPLRGAIGHIFVSEKMFSIVEIFSKQYQNWTQIFGFHLRDATFLEVKIIITGYLLLFIILFQVYVKQNALFLVKQQHPGSNSLFINVFIQKLIFWVLLGSTNENSNYFWKLYSNFTKTWRTW
jgi:hypothetical protein